MAAIEECYEEYADRKIPHCNSDVEIRGCHQFTIDVVLYLLKYRKGVRDNYGVLVSVIVTRI